jgi:hypothetical protein
MRKPALFARSAAVIALTICSAALSPMHMGTAAAAGGTRVPFSPLRRACDFTPLGNPNFGISGAGSGEALIHTSGNTVVADVHFVNSREPGIHFDVGLIQVPRPTSSPCGPGDPGTAYAGMDIGPDGTAAVTVGDQIRPGATGVWVQILRPSTNSQSPVEFYTSVFVAHI